MKNKKIVYLVAAISAVILAVVVFYAYRPADKQVREKTPQVKQANNTKEVKPTTKQPKKPPKVKTYKQEVIMSVSFDTGDKDQAVVIPKDPKKYGLAKEGNEMDDWGPSSIAVDKQENIYVLDSVASRIKKHNKDGKFIKNISLPLPAPNDIAVDNEGNLYLQDDGSYSVLKINQSGKVLLEYPLSEEIAPRWASPLNYITIISNTLYGIRSFSMHDTPDLFERFKYLKDGDHGSFEIGTTKQPFNSKQQVDSLKSGAPGEDGKYYKLLLLKKKLAFTDGSKTTFINYKNYQSNRRYRDISKIDKAGNVYFFEEAVLYKGLAYFLFQKYTSGKLVGEAILPYGSDYQWTKLAAVSDTGNIYYLYSDALSSDYKGGVKIIKCVLK